MDPTLRQRALTSALFVPVLLALFGLGGTILATGLCFLVTLAAYELSRLLDGLGLSGRGLFLLAPCFYAVALFAPATQVWEGLALSLAAASTLWLFRPWTPARPVAAGLGLFAQAIGAAYVGLLPSFLCRLESGPWIGRAAPEGTHWAMLALCLVWASDTGAYLAGTLLGRHRLWPAVSPKKTIEGAVGGVLLPLAAAMLLAPWLAPTLSTALAAGLGALTGIVAPIGDLIESRLKRKSGVKDSGQLLPGHGGVLDRFDSLFFAAPLFHYYLQAFAR